MIGLFRGEREDIRIMGIEVMIGRGGGSIYYSGD